MKIEFEVVKLVRGWRIKAMRPGDNDDVIRGVAEAYCEHKRQIPAAIKALVVPLFQEPK